MVAGISIKNIKHMFKEYKRTFMLLVISQFTAIIIIYFVYGLYNSYNASLQEMTINSYTIEASFTEDNISEFSELKECFNEVLDTVQDRLDYFFIMLRYEGIMINIHNQYNNNIFSFSDTVEENMVIESGRGFENKEIKDGENVAIATNLGDVGSKCNVGNISYNIIGIENFGEMNTDTKILEVPYKACIDKAQLATIILNFKELPRQTDYNKFKNILESKFGTNVIVQKFEVKDVEELTSTNSIIIFSLIIGVIAALDTCMLYGYIINKRKKNMAINRLIGAKKRQLFFINEIEIMIISISISLLGLFVYKLIIEKVIMSMYDNDLEIYQIENYIKMSVVYLLSILLLTSIMVFFYTKSNVKEMLRRGGND